MPRDGTIWGLGWQGRIIRAGNRGARRVPNGDELGMGRDLGPRARRRREHRFRQRGHQSGAAAGAHRDGDRQLRPRQRPGDRSGRGGVSGRPCGQPARVPPGGDTALGDGPSPRQQHRRLAGRRQRRLDLRRRQPHRAHPARRPDRRDPRGAALQGPAGWRPRLGGHRSRKGSRCSRTRRADARPHRPTSGGTRG